MRATPARTAVILTGLVAGPSSLRSTGDDVGVRLEVRCGSTTIRVVSPTVHDPRRTWTTALASEDVDPLLVCDWGGWNDLETFLDHYRGTFSPEAQKRARDGVAWL